MNRREIIEVFGIGAFLLLTLALCLKASNMNTESFNKRASSIVYSVRNQTANLREGPGKEFKVLTKVKEIEVMEFIKNEGNWIKVLHIESEKEGWIHRSVSRKYLRLKYYQNDLLTIGESVFEID